MTPPPTDPVAGSARSLWLGVGVLVGLTALAWFFMFSLSSKHPVESVPLEKTTTP